MRPTPALARLLMLSLLLMLLPPTPRRNAIRREEVASLTDSPEEGLRFRLSEGSEKIDRPKPNPAPPASPLSEKETQKLLARLPRINPDANDIQDFKLREGSLPPPRAGETIQAAFAQPSPLASPPLTKTTAPLEVSRYEPEGEVALAPALSVTFSQPMIAVTSQEETAANVPITLAPQPKGKWRWLGTQTLIFQPEMEGGRLPMATDYVVTIPAGIRSALGNTLPQAKTFTFSTPPPTLKSSYPGGQSQPRDALVFLEFDQRIDAARVLEGIRLESAASGARLRLATPEEIAADQSIEDLVKHSQEGRWLVFRAVDANGSTKDALPADTNIKIIIPPGTPSVEGSRTTTKEQSITFKTFGALRVTDTQCGYDKRCSPFDQFRITFNNQLDAETFQPSQVSIAPQIPDVKISLYGNSIKVEGVKRSNTTYTVTLDRSIKDVFGQTLTGDNQLVFKVTTADPRLFATGEGFIVLDPAVRRTFNVYSVNYHQLRVRLYKVTPDDWQQFRSFQAVRYNPKEQAMRMDFDGVNPPRPSSVTAEARVQDVNRQTLAATTTLLVHPADVYVGLKSARTFVQKGAPFDIAAIVTDLDGHALSDRDIKLRLVRLDYVYEKGEWKQIERDAQEQTVKSGQDAVQLRFATKEGGAYRLTAQVRDERERLNSSELSLWVAGGKLPPQREVEQERVELIPDRKSYKGGDVAEILVQSPFAPAEGVMTIRRSGLLLTKRFTLSESSYTLRVPLEEAMTPNVHVQVDLVGAAIRIDDESKARADLPKRTAFASGEINLEIPPASRRLSVKATPRDAVLEPGAETVVDVEVKDAQGKSVQGTDTAVVVVDESVLALTGYTLSDPLSIFYPERDADVSDYHLREKVKLASPDEVERLARIETPEGGVNIEGRQITELPISGRNYQALSRISRGVMDDSSNAAMATVNVTGSAEGGLPIELRKDFNALAVFAASVPTDAQGRAQVKIKLPDNLTRYHVAAVTVAGGKLSGAGEAVITARKSLMVRPSAPRFLNFGDHAELPVVLQNQSDKAMSVSVAVRATNADLTEGRGRRVVVPANDRVEVRFPIAALKPGTARFQVVTASNDMSDAAEVMLPVYTPATTEAFATYGVIDEGGSIAQPVKAPADAIKSFGGLEVTTSSTQLQELTDAVIYLVNYPYECSEQIASRIIAISALKDVLTAFKAKGLPSPEAMRDSVSSGIKQLQGLQNEDGGFDFWRRSGRSFPFVSVHVAHALIRAQSKGFAVPEEMMKSARDYLLGIEAKIPAEYSLESKYAIRAYALYVRALMKDRAAAEARKLIADAGGVEKLSMETLGWLLPVLTGDQASLTQVEAIRRHLNNRVTETAGAAHFADSYSDGAYTILQSDRRADGILLDALIGDQPSSDLIPKLVRGLLGGRTRGHWMNTQENVFILLALDRYFNTYEKTTPAFVARVWLGQAFAGEQTFKGRSIDRQQLNLPMSALVERTATAPANLTIGKEGAGRLYFRIGTRYAPSNLKLAAADYGFKVERKYEAVDNPSDVRRDADGTWHIKAGARVRVQLMMSNPARRYHVALVDPLPAGLEALNPELATTERLPEESTEAGILRTGRGIYDYYWSWRGTWYEHQNLRDERAEAFTSLLWEGEHVYTYFARATTPGLFVVPPTKAEEMYAPETFGRGGSDRVRVE